MNDDPNKVLKFRPRPKPPAPPKPPKTRSSRPRRGGEPAINWSRAPRALAIVALILIFLWLVGWGVEQISGIGVG
jgi:hypothetical protein